MEVDLNDLNWGNSWHTAMNSSIPLVKIGINILPSYFHPIFKECGTKCTILFRLPTIMLVFSSSSLLQCYFQSTFPHMLTPGNVKGN